MTVTVGSATSDAYLHRGATENSGVVYRQPTGQGLATNVDLRDLSQTELQTAISFLKGAGYHYVRQEIAWSDVESAPGVFDWTRYQPMLDALDQNGLAVVAVLNQTPDWARFPDTVNSLDAPPYTSGLFQTFCTALRGQFPNLRYFQIGSQLDNPDYWGGRPLVALVYRQLLEAASVGLGVASTDSILISGELGLDADIRAVGGDLAMIRRLLADVELRGLIRVLSVAVDGGVRSPYDRDTKTEITNLSRVVLVREAVDTAGAITMPIWFSHFGWTGADDSEKSFEEQSRFVDAGMRRVRNEWPWVGLVFNWAYNNSDPASLALVVSGNPTPLFESMSEYSQSLIGTSITNGFVPPDTDACSYTGNWQDQHLADGLYRTVRDPAASVTCRFWGTGFAAFFRVSPDAGSVRYVVDQDVLPLPGTDAEVGNVFLTFSVDDAYEIPVALAAGLDEGLHTVTIGLGGEGELVLGGFLVNRERPMIWPIAVLVVAGLVSLFLGLRTIAFTVAEHVHIIDARTTEARETPLPSFPNWTPDPRFKRR